jgi:transcriptional regulator with GAF, ATPase, and Fis domain/serine/threonine protein kinase/tetratricopeptide (TPR) repeat protein
MQILQTSVGPFELIRLLGEGAMGRVWLVHDPRRKQDVAFKELKMSRLKNHSLDQLKNEFDLLTRLHHPCLAQVHHFGVVTANGRYFFTCDHATGKPLAQALAGQPLAAIEAVFRKILLGLAYIHARGVTHLDLKDDNILVSFEGGEPEVKILDFGVAQVGRSGHQRVGTPATMSPEMIRAAGDVDGRADLYAVGILLYHSLSRQWPFPVRNVEDVYRWHLEGHLPEHWDAPDYLRDLVRQLTEKNVSDRLSGARAALHFLDAVHGHSFLTSLPLGLEGPMIERDDLLRVVREEWAKKGSPATLKLWGPPGYGKTRVLKEIRSVLELAEIRVLSVRSDGDEGVWSQLAGQLGSLSLSPVEVEGALLSAPSALLIDEIDAAPLHFREWVKGFERKVEQGLAVGLEWKVFLITTSTKKEGRALTPLSEEGVGIFLGHFLDDSTARAFAPLLHQWSGGVPYWVHKGLRACEAQLSKKTVPKKIPLVRDEKDFFKNEIVALSAHHGRLLRLMACLDRPIGMGIASDISFATDSDWSALHESGWLQKRDGFISFRSHLQRHRLWDAATDTEKMEAARWWLDRPEWTTLADRCRLHEIVGEKELAAEQCLQWGILEKGEGRHWESLQAFERASFLTVSPSLKEKAVLEQARLKLVLADVEGCRALLETVTDSVSPLWHELWGWYFLRKNNLDAAKESFVAAKNGLAQEQHYWRIRLINTLAQIDMQQGHSDQAIALYRESFQLEAALSPVERAKGTNNQLALAYAQKGDHDLALRWLDDRLASDDLDQTHRMALLGHVGFVCLQAGRLERAADALEEVVRMGESLDYVDERTVHWGNLFSVYQKQGRYAHALEILDRIITHERQLARLQSLAHYHLQEASLYLNLRQKDALLRSVKQGRAIASEIGPSHLLQWFDLLEAHAEKEFGDAARALELLAAVHDGDAGAWARLLEVELMLNNDRARARVCLEKITPIKDVEFVLKFKFLRLKLHPFDGAAWQALIDDCRDADELFFDVALDFFKLSPSKAAKTVLKATFIQRLEAALRNVPEEFKKGYLQNKNLPDIKEAPMGDVYKKILHIQKRLSRECEPDVLMGKILDEAMEWTGVEEGLILDGALKVVAGRNVARGDGQDANYSRSLAGQVLANGRTVISQDAAGDESLNVFASVMAQNLKSVACAPLRAHDQIIGILYLSSTRPDLLEDFLEPLEVFAEQASLALQKVLDLKKRDDRLKAKEVELAQKDAEIDSLEALVAQGSEATVFSYEHIIGKSKVMHEVFRVMDKISRARVPVFIHGESGTGKELIAKALHHNSGRRQFVAVNCSAFSETILESELFGHMKGAFTGADRDRAGLFETADRGTIFLDEVGDMSLGMQAKILRAIQEQEIMRVGGRAPVKIDVRIVSASNKDLRQMVREKSFREDLYFRLSGIRLDLPPLRSRREDLPLLVDHFVKKICQENELPKIKVSQEAWARLLAHDWPGNVRELEQVLTAAVLMCDKGVIRPENLGLGAVSSVPSSLEDGFDFQPGRPLEEYERSIILKTYEHFKRNKSTTAKHLGLSRLTLHKKLAAYGVD